MTTNNMVSLFSLNASSGIPIYRQLIDQIKQAIRMQLLKPNEQLPSVRSLATALQINPMTISKAFAQLELEGVLTRKRGVGMLVADANAEQGLSHELELAMSQFVAQARNAGLDDEAILTLIQQHLSLTQNAIQSLTESQEQP